MEGLAKRDIRNVRFVVPLQYANGLGFEECPCTDHLAFLLFMHGCGFRMIVDVVGLSRRWVFHDSSFRWSIQNDNKATSTRVAGVATRIRMFPSINDTTIEGVGGENPKKTRSSQKNDTTLESPMDHVKHEEALC